MHFSCTEETATSETDFPTWTAFQKQMKQSDQETGKTSLRKLHYKSENELAVQF